MLHSSQHSLLVHLKVQRSVEALKVVAGGGPAGEVHPHLALRAGQAHLTGGGGDLLVLVGQLLLDEGHGVVRLSEPLGLQLVQEVLVAETLHEVDADRVGGPDLHGPGDGDGVGGGGVQLGEGRDGDWSGRSSWRLSCLTVGYRVGKRTQFVVNLWPGSILHIWRIYFEIVNIWLEI